MAEKVLSELFEHFHKLIDFNYNKSDVFKLVPYDFQNYLHAAHKGEQDSTPARVVLDFISGMTDQYALDTWKLVSQPHYLRFTG